MKKTEKDCLHPMEKAFKEPREDGSGKWDLICGYCGFTICEIGNPLESGSPLVEEIAAMSEEQRGEIVELLDGAIEHIGNAIEEIEAAVVCTNTDCPEMGKQGCTKMTTATEMLECIDFISSKEAVGDALGVGEVSDENASVSSPSTLIEEGEGETTSPFTSDGNQPTSYVSREADKIGGRFQELLPVPVDDHELAQFGIELAEQTSLWRRTKLDAKKFAKAAKDVTDKCEERMIEIEEIFQDHARMVPVDVQWEYDFTSGVKKLRRCDTWEITKEEILSVEERQPSFDFAASEKAVEKLREVQSGENPPLEGEGGEEIQTPLTDDPAEGCSKCEGAGYYYDDNPDSGATGEIFCDCEAGELLKKQSDPDAGLSVIQVDDFPFSAEPLDLETLTGGAPVINVDEKPEIDKNRTCCMPSDRDEIRVLDVIVSYCRECGLIHKKSPVGGDPWDSITFAPGEKVNLEEIQAAKA